MLQPLLSLPKKDMQQKERGYKIMIKRGLLNVSGFVFSIASPLVPIIMNWGSLVNKNTWTAVSIVALFIILACVAVFNLIFKGSKVPIKANKLWLGGAILLTL